MSTNTSDPQVLVIGVDPNKMGGGFDPAPVAAAIEAGMVKLAEHAVTARACLFGVDGTDDPGAMVTAALRERPWTCVVIGVGLRKSEPMLELFERVVNLSRQHAPGAAIAFNATIPDFYEAAARWLDRPSPQCPPPGERGVGPRSRAHTPTQGAPDDFGAP